MSSYKEANSYFSYYYIMAPSSKSELYSFIYTYNALCEEVSGYLSIGGEVYSADVNGEDMQW